MRAGWARRALAGCAAALIFTGPGVAQTPPSSPPPVAAPTPAPGKAGCRLIVTPGGELPAQVVHHRIYVPITIDGRPARAILDTGADRTLLSTAAARRLGLPLRADGPGSVFYGAGGASEALTTTLDFGFAGATTPHLQMYVTGETRLDADMLLGGDFLSRFDLELDIAHHLVRIIQPRNCRDDQLPYWATAWSEAAMQDLQSADHEIVLAVRLNGRPLRAVLDTGAPTTVVTLAGARQAHVPLATGEAAGRMQGGGIGGARFAEQIARVDSFEVGGERINNTAIVFGDMFAAATREETGSLVAHAVGMPDDMLLGYDFLAAHHVLISRSHHKVFFTYNGGPVFDTRAPAATAASPPASEPAPHTGA